MLREADCVNKTYRDSLAMAKGGLVMARHWRWKALETAKGFLQWIGNGEVGRGNGLAMGLGGLVMDWQSPGGEGGLVMARH